MTFSVPLLAFSAPLSDVSPTIPSSPSSLSAPSDTLSNEEKLRQLAQQIDQNPNDLDANFAYAQLATALGKHHEAIAAYERMLILNPTLLRVKLDMALVYMKMRQFDEALRIFDEVKAGEDVPEAVQKNIDRLMQTAKKGMKRHHIGGSIVVGFNSDSNANSSPSASFITDLIADLEIDEEARPNSDDHRFGAITLKHIYTPPSTPKLSWQTEATVYKTDQSSLENLDVTVYNVKTGPRIALPEARVSFGANIGYSDINLAQYDYLRVVSQELYGTWTIHPKAQLRASASHETRRFRNSPNSSTYEDRSGRAMQQKLGMAIVLTPKDMLNIEVKLRQEKTQERYYDNRQSGLTISHVHQFDKGYFLSTSAGLKQTHYKGIDGGIGASEVREDVEKSASITVGKKLTKQLTLSATYQYKTVDSSLQLYSYENERVAVAMSYQF